MPLQDVSDDQLMISWLRQTGHGHLIEDQHPNTRNASSPPPPIPLVSNPPYESKYPPQSPPNTGGFNTSVPPFDTLNRSRSFPHTDHLNQPPNYNAANSPPPPMIPPTTAFNGPPYNQQHSPLNFIASPTQFMAHNANDQQIDINIENMRRDPNTQFIQRPPAEDVVYKQRVFVRYLQPPTPPAGGTIIVREKQEPGPPPDPPIVIKRAPPPPPTPPPVIIRERPPPIQPAGGTTVIDKIVPSGPKPSPQIIIEQYPQLPQKPQDVIIERWLPVPTRQRRIVYERLPPTNRPTGGPPIIVQYGPPNVRIQREVIAAPGTNLPYQQATSHTDINRLLSQLGTGNQPISSTLSPSSLIGYDPYATLQPSYGAAAGQSQPNIVTMQNGQPSLGAYGSGTSAVPMIGHTAGQSTVYNIPDNIPIDGVLRQLGIDPSTIQRSTAYPSSDPHNAVSHVWNAASHGTPSAISNVWNTAPHASDQHRPGSSASGRVWDRIENYLSPQSSADAGRSVWNPIPYQNPPASSSNNPYPAAPPASSTNNYPPAPAAYPPTGSGSSVLSRLFGGS